LILVCFTADSAFASSAASVASLFLFLVSFLRSAGGPICLRFLPALPRSFTGSLLHLPLFNCHGSHPRLIITRRAQKVFYKITSILSTNTICQL
jgi:hypothetical protein